LPYRLGLNGLEAGGGVSARGVSLAGVCAADSGVQRPQQPGARELRAKNERHRPIDSRPKPEHPPVLGWAAIDRCLLSLRPGRAGPATTAGPGLLELRRRLPSARRRRHREACLFSRLAGCSGRCVVKMTGARTLVLCPNSTG